MTEAASIPKNTRVVIRAGAYPHRKEETVAWERDVFEKAGYEYRFLEIADSIDAIEGIREANALICSGGVWDERIFAECTKCVVLVNCGVGLDNIDVAAATRQGIMVCNMPDLCTEEVADHTFALLLACVRKISRLHARTRQGHWDRALLEPMPRLRGATLGLLAFGRISQAVASRAESFGMDVIAFDPLLVPEIATRAHVELVDLPDLCRESDVVSCHIPLSPATRHLLGEAEFRTMKTTAYFLNTSRGAVVDERALIFSLRNGLIAGAGLDVLEDEPPDPSNPLLSMDNVIVTPHTAGYSEDVVDEIPRLAVREVLSVLESGAPTLGGWRNRPELLSH